MQSHAGTHPWMRWLGIILYGIRAYGSINRGVLPEDTKSRGRGAEACGHQSAHESELAGVIVIVLSISKSSI